MNRTSAFPTNSLRFTALVAIVILLSGLIANLAQAQTSTGSLAPQPDVLAQMAESGRARVIAQVAAPFNPVADAPTTAAAQAVTDAVRASLIDRLTAAGAAEVVSGSHAWAIPYIALNVDEAAYLALLEQPDVLAVQADMRLQSSGNGIDPAAINVNAVWAGGQTGVGRTIAIVDTGVQASHSAFGGRVVQEACFSSETSISTPLCPNAYDIQVGVGAASPARCISFYGAGSMCEHGTHVASIAAGDDAAVRGMAPSATLIAVQTFARFNDTAQPEAWVGDLLSSLNYVYSLRNRYSIVAVNMSMGTGVYTGACDGLYSSVNSMFATLRAAGIAPVAAAGNSSANNGLAFPACISSAVSVGASSGGGRAWFSNSAAAQLTLFAPGASVYGAFSGGYGTLSGTSVATPHVSGAFALLRAASSNPTVEQIVAAMRATGAPVPVPDGTTPHLNVDAAWNRLAGTSLTVAMAAQGRPLAPSPQSAVAAVVRVTRTSDLAVLVNSTFTTEASGQVTVGALPAGAYQVWAKGSNTLAATATITLSAAATINLGTLASGDVNNDNVVNIGDFSLLAASFGTTSGGPADMNADGAVNISDFSLLAANFGAAGAP